MYTRYIIYILSVTNSQSYVSLVISKSDISESSKSPALTVVRADRDVATAKENNGYLVLVYAHPVLYTNTINGT